MMCCHYHHRRGHQWSDPGAVSALPQQVAPGDATVAAGEAPEAAYATPCEVAAAAAAAAAAAVAADYRLLSLTARVGRPQLLPRMTGLADWLRIAAGPSHTAIRLQC